MQDIAADVGFTAPALYAYFPSKGHIFTELRAMLLRELADTFQPPPAAGQAFRRRLTILLHRQLEWADRRRDVLLAFTAMRRRGEGMPLGPQAAQALPDHGPAAHFAAMSRWLRQAAESPDDLGGCDPDEATCALLGICHGFLLRWLFQGRETRLADETERILDLFFFGVRGVARVPSTPRRRPVRRARPRSAP